MHITVLFSDHGDIDCAKLPKMWEGLHDVTVFNLTKQMTNTEWETIVHEALTSPCDLFLMCGHGTSNGLLAPDFSEYVIHKHCAPYGQKNVVGIFCHASEFAASHGLHGFYTSMFISNIGEAADYCVETVFEEIEEQNTHFYQEVHQLLEQGIPVADWLDHFSVSIQDTPLVQFNIGGLKYC